MDREEAEKAREILSRPFDMKGTPDEIFNAHAMAIKALERMDVLEKVRAEIVEKAKCNMNENRATGLYIALDIIDKYRREK